ncbi:MAG: hypothetical protein ACI4XS_07960 [Bacillus sp. (in: firmicutes)]
MDKVLLYRRKDDEITVYIYGYLKKGQLEVMVAFIEKKWNDEIHEYYYLLTQEETLELHNMLKEEMHSDAPLLDLVQEMFKGPECEKKLIEYLEEHNIQYTYYAY